MIEDVFDVSGRGIILAPGFPTSQYKFNREYEAFIKDSAGNTKNCMAKFIVPFVTPPRKVINYYCHLSWIEKKDIIIGSELWLVGVKKMK